MRNKTVSVLSAVLLLVLSFAVIELGAYLGYRSAMAGGIVMPTATLAPTATPLQSSALAAVPVLVYHEPDSEVIAGLQTYGQNQPLTESELYRLVLFLNSDPLPMEEDAYYITFLASATAYRDFLQDYGESLQSYLLRHVAWMDREIRFADPPVVGGLVARRMIVIEDGIWNSDNEERGIDYLAHGLIDSDGSWSFIDSYCPECAYYDQKLRLDFGLTHEWIHAIFKLPDHYALDFHPQFDINGVLAGVPEGWQFYSAGDRPDISRNDFAMGGGGSVLRRYSALKLAERRARGVTHDKERAWDESNFLAQVPAQVVWDFGSGLAAAPILVYRSQPCPEVYPDSWASACKILGSVPIFHGRLDERGRVAVGNLFSDFEDTAPPHKEGVLFVRVLVGEDYRFRWLDIRDFNLAIWEGFGESVVMRFNLASADTNPEDFVWDVSYESLDP